MPINVNNHIIAEKIYCQVKIKLLENHLTLMLNNQRKINCFNLSYMYISKCCQNQLPEKSECPLIKNIYQKQPGTGSYPKDIKF